MHYCLVSFNDPFLWSVLWMILFFQTFKFNLNSYDVLILWYIFVLNRYIKFWKIKWRHRDFWDSKFFYVPESYLLFILLRFSRKKWWFFCRPEKQYLKPIKYFCFYLIIGEKEEFFLSFRLICTILILKYISKLKKADKICLVSFWLLIN